MKSIKIGRSRVNDIIVDDITVSSEHAKITISDSGQVQIKDLNSKNGTFVNGKKITTEVAILATDEIKVATITIDWVRYINKTAGSDFAKKNSFDVSQTKTIGRLDTNDIRMAYNDVSASHATLIKKNNGEIFIKDNSSKNGTFVNGKNIDIRILIQGDVVLIANKYPLNWQNAFASIERPKKTKVNHKTLFAALIGAAAMIVIALVLWIFKPVDVFSTYKKSVVLIHLSYSYHVTVKDKDLENWIINNDSIVRCDGSNLEGGWGTGFFISKDGKIITNRHIAVPWEYNEGPNEAEKIKTYFQNYFTKKAYTEDIRYLQLVNEIKVNGEMSSVGIFVNDTYVESLSELIPCSVIKESGDYDKDVALLQVHSKLLPTGITKFIDLKQAVTDSKDANVGTEILTIGFPTGPILSNTKQGIQANFQDGKITQLRSDVEFGHNISIVGGASGSPVFTKSGQLIGIINRGYTGSQGYNMAIWAKCAVELAK